MILEVCPPAFQGVGVDSYPLVCLLTSCGAPPAVTRTAVSVVRRAGQGASTATLVGRSSPKSDPQKNRTWREILPKKTAGNLSVDPVSWNRGSAAAAVGRPSVALVYAAAWSPLRLEPLSLALAKSRKGKGTTEIRLKLDERKKHHYKTPKNIKNIW